MTTAKTTRMADPALHRKLKLKPGLRAAVFGAPSEYAETLAPLPEGTTMVEDPNGPDAQFDWVQLFVKDRAALERELPQARRALKPVSQLWISYPKGSSKIQTDLTRDRGWEPLENADLLWINLISIDGTWSAFGLRPLKPGESKQKFREAPSPATPGPRSAVATQPRLRAFHTSSTGQR